MPKLRQYPAQKWLLACSVALVAGCGSPGPNSLEAQQSNQGINQSQSISQSQGQQQGQQQDPLGLSQQQQQQLAQTFQSLQPDESQQKGMQQIQTLLLADQVDVAGLTGALDSARQSQTQNVDKVVTMFRNLRETLDNTQRQKLVGLMQQQASQAPQPEFPAELQLTQQQKDALLALQPDQKQMNQALISYFQSGDEAILRQAIAADIAAQPKPQVVANALASLSKDQRQKMFGQQQQGGQSMQQGPGGQSMQQGGQSMQQGPGGQSMQQGGQSLQQSQ